MAKPKRTVFPAQLIEQYAASMTTPLTMLMLEHRVSRLVVEHHEAGVLFTCNLLMDGKPILPRRSLVITDRKSKPKRK